MPYWLHPLRHQHLALSMLNLCAPWIRQAAESAKADREFIAGDNLWRGWEQLASDGTCGSANSSPTRSELAHHAAVPKASSREADWEQLLDAQTLVRTFAQSESLAALPRLLPTQVEREQAPALAAAVLLAAPRRAESPATVKIGIGKALGVDVGRVAALALSLAQMVATRAADGAVKPVPGVTLPTDPPTRSLTC